MDKGYQAGNLVFRAIEGRHPLVGASTADYWADLVAVHILGYKLRASKIRASLATTGVAAMTE
jgi:hypothetical protein